MMKSKIRIIRNIPLVVAFLMLPLDLCAAVESEPLEESTLPLGLLDSISTNLGVDLFESEIDDVIFQTNQFLCDPTFTGSQGPFWWILECCMALGALFALIMAAGMAYKMMIKGEPFDVMKVLRVLGIAIVMFLWYPNNGSGGCILGVLAYIPNCVGSFTHALYETEAGQVQAKYDSNIKLIQRRDSFVCEAAVAEGLVRGAMETQRNRADQSTDVKTEIEANKQVSKFIWKQSYMGLMVIADKLVMFFSLIIFRIGWWGTIFCQQVLLGMLTIFGPLQWAFSILPKWEGSWAKWITRYLTVHFYGAMLYFVGFYVLLLWDIVLSLQTETLVSITTSQLEFNSYLNSAFMTAGYLLVASIVSLRCLNLVPDLAAWMIPEGDTAFSTRSFGEGVASGVKAGAASAIGKVL